MPGTTMVKSSFGTKKYFCFQTFFSFWLGLKSPSRINFHKKHNTTEQTFTVPNGWQTNTDLLALPMLVSSALEDNKQCNLWNHLQLLCIHQRGGVLDARSVLCSLQLHKSTWQIMELVQLCLGCTQCAASYLHPCKFPCEFCPFFLSCFFVLSAHLRYTLTCFKKAACRQKWPVLQEEMVLQAVKTLAADPEWKPQPDLAKVFTPAHTLGSH